MARRVYANKAILWAGGFRGLYQDGDGCSTDMRYAAEGENFGCEGGMLRPAREGEALPGKLDGTIGTLAALHRRYHVAEGEDPTLLVAASGGGLYARAMNEEEWRLIWDGLTTDRLDFVSYEVNGYYRDGEGKRLAPSAGETGEWVDAEAPIDILLLTNALDGMIMVYGDTRETVPVRIQPRGAEEVRFGVLARHAERIWGSGILEDPDKLMYSAPFDPFNWEQNDDMPEDGAGDILQPSWDGDSFMALRPMGSQLLAVKKNRIWRILGTDPSQYVMKEQYGGGTVCENSLVVYGSSALMLGRDGLIRYDSVSAELYGNERIRKILRRINWDAAHRACAGMRGEIYCLALPLDGSERNNALLEYHTREGTFTLAVGVEIQCFLEMEGRLLFADGAGYVREAGRGQALPMRWEGPWQDLDRLDCVKRRFVLRLQADSPAKLGVGIRTERGLWKKNVQLEPEKTRRVMLEARGHRFRLELTSQAGQDFGLLAGVQICCELDQEE